jgi:hypothetical protein
MGSLNNFWNYLQAESIIKEGESDMLKKNRLFDLSNGVRSEYSDIENGSIKGIKK